MAKDFETTGGDARAVRIAADLARAWGDDAFDRATAHADAARAAGNLAKTDLLRAVCTIIANRDGVFSRWRAAQPVVQPGPDPFWASASASK